MVAASACVGSGGVDVDVAGEAAGDSRQSTINIRRAGWEIGLQSSTGRREVDGG